MAGSEQKHVGIRGKANTLASFGRHVSSGKARFFQAAGIDFVMGRREGPYIWDVSGQVRLIDCHCNGGVYNLGHRNPKHVSKNNFPLWPVSDRADHGTCSWMASKLIQVLVESLGNLDIGNHHLVSEPRAALAEQLAGLTPGHLTYTVFAVAGGEAIDLAIKVTRGYATTGTVRDPMSLTFALCSGRSPDRARFQVLKRPILTALPQAGGGSVRRPATAYKKS